MPHFKIVLITLFCLTCTQLEAGITQDSTKNDRNSLKGFPIVYFTPETDWAFGLIGIYAFRLKSEADDTRPSQLSIASAYTLNNQILFYMPFQIFSQQAKWNIYGELGYFKYNYF